MEAELVVKGDRLAVVVHHREIHVGRAASLELLREPTHQRLPESGVGRLRGNRKAPKRRASLRIAEGVVMIDAHHGAENGAALGILRNKHGQSAVIAA